MAANTLIPVPSWTFPVRIAQFVISFLVLIFTIIPIALWSGYYSFGLGIFTCIATAAITVYWYYANKRSPTVYNRWAILFLDCWAVVWWLVSFSILAELASAFIVIAGLEEEITASPLPGNIKTSRALTALAAFLGAVEFVLFIITLITFSTRLHRQRRDEMQPMQNANSDLEVYPNNENMEPGAKAGPYVSSQPVQGFAHV